MPHMDTHTTTGAGYSAAQQIQTVELRPTRSTIEPYAHYTLHEDGNVSVIVQGLPLCIPTTFERARKVALSNGLGNFLPVWDAQFGKFGVTWPRN